MVLKRSLLDTPENITLMALAQVGAWQMMVAGDDGPRFVQKYREAALMKTTELKIRALSVIGTDRDGSRDLEARLCIWQSRLAVLDKVVGEISGDQPINPVEALTAMAYLEAEMTCFSYTLEENQRHYNTSASAD